LKKPWLKCLATTVTLQIHWHTTHSISQTVTMVSCKWNKTEQTGHYRSAAERSIVSINSSTVISWSSVTIIPSDKKHKNDSMKEKNSRQFGGRRRFFHRQDIVVPTLMQVYPQIQLSELKLYFHSKITHTQPFNDPLSGTTQVGRYEKKHSPTHTNPDHQTSFINFLHLLWSTASSLFNLRACQSFSTTSLPLGLGPSTSHYIHFFTQSLSSFITNAHTITAKLMARISKHCQKDIQ